MARGQKQGLYRVGQLIGIAGIAVVFIVIPAVLTFAVYATVFCILIGLLIFEIGTGDRPSIEDAGDVYTATDLTELDSLRDQQNELRNRRQNIYERGIRDELEPRNDKLRFDGRQSLARRLNGELDSLDNEFDELSSKMHKLKQKVRKKRDKSWDKVKGEIKHWQYYSSGRLAARIAISSYLIVVAILLTFDPLWVQNLSIIVLHHVWFPVTPLSAGYGAMVIASASATIIGGLVWTIKFQQLESSLPRKQPGTNKFNEKWEFSSSEELACDFKNTYWA
jgi:hypothetical protein